MSSPRSAGGYASTSLMNVLLVVAIAVLLVVVFVRSARREVRSELRAAGDAVRRRLEGYSDDVPWGYSSQDRMLQEVPFYAPDGNLARQLLAHERTQEMDNENYQYRMRLMDHADSPVPERVVGMLVSSDGSQQVPVHSPRRKV